MWVGKELYLTAQQFSKENKESEIKLWMRYFIEELPRRYTDTDGIHGDIEYSYTILFDQDGLVVYYSKRKNRDEGKNEKRTESQKLTKRVIIREYEELVKNMQKRIDDGVDWLEDVIDSIKKEQEEFIKETTSY